MNENANYDNGFSNAIVAIIGTVVRTLERSVVVFWDGLRNATVHGTPSLLGFVAATSPIVAPLFVAIQTSRSLVEFMNEPMFQAVIGAIALEFIGFELWVFLTEILMKGKWDGTRIQYALAGGVVVYELALIGINVVLKIMRGATGNETIAEGALLFLWCLLPALAAIGYGYSNAQNKAELEQERQEAKEQREKERQERRQDRKERAERTDNFRNKRS